MALVAAVGFVAPGVVQVTENFLVEVEGQAKPACIAESVIRIAF